MEELNVLIDVPAAVSPMLTETGEKALEGGEHESREREMERE
jgi:hypothetical protein